MNRKALFLAYALLGLFATHVFAQDDTTPNGLVAPWVFALGEWGLVETRYSFEGELIQTNIGSAVFSYAMNGERLQESQALLREGETQTALHLFVLDPRTKEVEITRTDSDSYGFWTIIGTLTEDGITLVEKHPDSKSDVTRRITYKRVDNNHFSRQLDFSTDKGKTWFLRSEWVYTRK